MRILIAGGSGFLGSRLVPHLRLAGHDVVRLVRRPSTAPDEVRWDPAAGTVDVDLVGSMDAVVNLAGANVGARRWSAAYKKTLVDSRVDTTTTLARAIAAAGGAGTVLVNSSAVGYYGDTGDRAVDENAPGGDTFLAELCKVWEGATRPAEEAGARVVLLRTGLPLAREDGLLRPLYWQFQLFGGGRMGSGRQFWPWISPLDWMRAVAFLLARDDIAGPVNVGAPEPVRNAEFAATLGRVLHRPALVPVPAFALRAVLGEFAGEALTSQRMVPGVLTAAGFTFEHPTVESALRWAVEH